MQLCGFKLDNDLTLLESLFSRVNVDSGTIWTSESKIREKIRKDRRVDAYLINSMSKAAQKLETKGSYILCLFALCLYYFWKTREPQKMQVCMNR